MRDATTEVVELPELLTPDQLADYLEIPKLTVYRWNSRGGGPERIKIGKHVRYTRAAINHWLNNSVVKDSVA